MSIRPALRLVLFLTALAVLALGAVGCGGDDDDGSANAPATTGAMTEETTELSGTIAGAGSSAQAAAQEAWIAGFQEQNPDVTISYDPIGSGGGREQFVAGGTAYGGSDAHLADEELTGGQDRCGGPDNLLELPVYVSPIAVAYNLSGVEALQLSPETLAKIMNQTITKWNDPAIAADNPDADLPDGQITPVNRSDESGTTENFVDYLSQVVPDVWTYEVSGDWPVKGGEAAEGTSGVVDAIKSGEGTIGYADASQVGDLGVATIKVGDAFVGPSAEAAAKILDESEETDDPGQFVFTYTLNRQTDAEGTYPIVLVSYELACTQYDSAGEAAIVKGYLDWIISADGQSVAAEAAGSAPITDSLRELIQPAVEAIQTR